MLGWTWIAVLGAGPIGPDEIERSGGDVAVRWTTAWDAWALVLALAAAAAALWSRQRALARVAAAAALALAGRAAYFLGLP